MGLAVAKGDWDCATECPVLQGLSSSASIASQFCSSLLQTTVTITYTDFYSTFVTKDEYTVVTSVVTYAITDYEVSAVTSTVSVMTDIVAKVQ